MLRGAESKGKLPHLFIHGKTGILVLEFPVGDLPLSRTASLVPAFAVKDLPLGRTLWWYISILLEIYSLVKILMGPPYESSHEPLPLKTIWYWLFAKKKNHDQNLCKESIGGIFILPEQTTSRSICSLLWNFKWEHRSCKVSLDSTFKKKQILLKTFFPSFYCLLTKNKKRLIS